MDMTTVLIVGMIVVCVLITIGYLYLVYSIVRNINLYKEDWRVGVICKNYNDFQSWRINNELVPLSNGSDFLNKRMFKVENTTYIALSDPTDLCSQMFNVIRETPLAHENETYDEIKEMLPTQMRKL